MRGEGLKGDVDEDLNGISDRLAQSADVSRSEFSAVQTWSNMSNAAQPYAPILSIPYLVAFAMERDRFMQQETHKSGLLSL